MSADTLIPILFLSASLFLAALGWVVRKRFLASDIDKRPFWERGIIEDVIYRASSKMIFIGLTAGFMSLMYLLYRLFQNWKSLF